MEYKNISELFSKCSLLKILPYISKWNISNVNNMSGIFSGCSNEIINNKNIFHKYN